MSDECDVLDRGYNNGLMAASFFLRSGKSFERWYGDGPSEICPGWLDLLRALGREQEYYDLKDKLDKEKEDER